MSKYNITSTAKARENGAKANREALKAYLRENNGKTCKEIAEDCGTTSRTIQGVICNCWCQDGYYSPNGVAVAGRKTVERNYVELNPDGSINPENIITMRYKVNTYKVR